MVDAMANTPPPPRPSHGPPPPSTPGDGGVEVLGATRAPLSDLYHLFLRLSWPVALLLIALFWVATNALFAVVYMMEGGVAHMEPGSFADAFFFSVQTMGTIGYGNLYPESMTANILVPVQSVSSLVMFALVTGLIFAKFALS